MRLGDMQAHFARTMLSHPDAVSKPDPFLGELFSTDERILPERLKIYRNNIVGSLTNSMLATYPLIKILTGEEFATVLMRSFVLENPPREACLGKFGAGLGVYIETYAPAKELAYLSDVARFEWAMNEAYNAPDDLTLTPEDFQAVPAEKLGDLSLRLRSSVRLLSSPWPLDAIRAFCLNYREDSDETLNLDGGRSWLMVYRPHLTVEVISLDPSECVWLAYLSEGQTLCEALEHVLETFPSFDFQGCLQKYLRLQTFSGISANTHLTEEKRED